MKTIKLSDKRMTQLAKQMEKENSLYSWKVYKAYIALFGYENTTFKKVHRTYCGKYRTLQSFTQHIYQPVIAHLDISHAINWKLLQKQVMEDYKAHNGEYFLSL